MKKKAGVTSRKKSTSLVCCIEIYFRKLLFALLVYFIFFLSPAFVSDFPLCDFASFAGVVTKLFRSLVLPAIPLCSLTPTVVSQKVVYNFVGKGTARRACCFLCATAGTAIARLSHRNSVRPSVTRVDQAKTVQARIMKSSPSAAPKTLASGSVTLFQKFHRGHPNRGP